MKTRRIRRGILVLAFLAVLAVLGFLSRWLARRACDPTAAEISARTWQYIGMRFECSLPKTWDWLPHWQVLYRDTNNGSVSGIRASLWEPSGFRPFRPSDENRVQPKLTEDEILRRRLDGWSRSGWLWVTNAEDSVFRHLRGSWHLKQVRIGEYLKGPSLASLSFTAETQLVVRRFDSYDAETNKFALWYHRDDRSYELHVSQPDYFPAQPPDPDDSGYLFNIRVEQDLMIGTGEYDTVLVGDEDCGSTLFFIKEASQPAAPDYSAPGIGLGN